MPSNRDFTLEILIGGLTVPEYSKDGEHYVECNLNTPLTYREKRTEVVSGSTESQEYPVTPYQIRVTAHTSGDNPHYFRILVDGIKVKSVSLEAGQSRLVKGFRDGPWVRELLFSMPRFARDEHDRLTPDRKESIGRIEVECWEAALKTRKLGLRFKELNFEQANKKDSSSVTHGKYIMATSRAGKRVASRSLIRSVDSWKLERRLSAISVQYHMSHTLVEMGHTLRPMDFSLITTSHDNVPGPGGVKREIKQEPGPRHARKRRYREHRRENSGDAAAALLALGAAENVGRASTSTNGQSGSQSHTQSSHPANTSHSRDSAQIDADNDYGELEIIQYVKSSTTPAAKMPKSEPALIDLTFDDSDKEDAARGRLPRIQFEGITEIKGEMAAGSTIVSTSTSSSVLPDSGISTGTSGYNGGLSQRSASPLATTQSSPPTLGIVSGVDLESDMTDPSQLVAMETVVECCEVPQEIDDIVEVEQSVSPDVKTTETTYEMDPPVVEKTDIDNVVETACETTQSESLANAEKPSDNDVISETVPSDKTTENAVGNSATESSVTAEIISKVDTTESTVDAVIIDNVDDTEAMVTTERTDKMDATINTKNDVVVDENVAEIIDKADTVKDTKHKDIKDNVDVTTEKTETDIAVKNSEKVTSESTSDLIATENPEKPVAESSVSADLQTVQRDTVDSATTQKDSATHRVDENKEDDSSTNHVTTD